MQSRLYALLALSSTLSLLTTSRAAAASASRSPSASRQSLTRDATASVREQTRANSVLVNDLLAAAAGERAFFSVSRSPETLARALSSQCAAHAINTTARCKHLLCLKRHLCIIITFHSGISALLFFISYIYNSFLKSGLSICHMGTVLCINLTFFNFIYSQQNQPYDLRCLMSTCRIFSERRSEIKYSRRFK